MAAHLVATVHVHDAQALMAGYVPASAKLVEEMGGNYTLRARGGQVIEGDAKDGALLVIIEWPSRDAALSFLNSPEYAEVKKLRDGVADVEITIFES